MTLALVFPGQGAQYVGMGIDLAAASPRARRLLDQADAVLGFALSRVMAQGPDSELTRTDVSQPAILVASLMALAVLEEHVKPSFVAAAGLSLGEYTALVAAGAFAYADAVRLVRLRGQAMQDAAERVPSGMVALIGADEVSASALCALVAEGDVLQIANLNATGQVVISGARAACERAVRRAKEVGIRKAMALNVAGAFHSALMAPAAERLRAALASAAMNDARVPVYANVHARPVTSAAEIRELLVAQLTQPVRFAASVENMRAAGVDEFWELGPGKSLSGMIARTVEGAKLRNLDKAADAAAFATTS